MPSEIRDRSPWNAEDIPIQRSVLGRLYHEEPDRVAAYVERVLDEADGDLLILLKFRGHYPSRIQMRALSRLVDSIEPAPKIAALRPQDWIVELVVTVVGSVIAGAILLKIEKWLKSEPEVQEEFELMEEYDRKGRVKRRITRWKTRK